MRSVIDHGQITPVGMWLRQYAKDSTNGGLSITNLDYVIEDYKQKKIMILEEKQNRGSLHKAQMLTFSIVDRALSAQAFSEEYDYWGFFVLQLPNGCDQLGPGMTLNKEPISVEQFRDHVNFDVKFCAGLFWSPQANLWKLRDD